MRPTDNTVSRLEAVQRLVRIVRFDVEESVQRTHSSSKGMLGKCEASQLRAGRDLTRRERSLWVEQNEQQGQARGNMVEHSIPK